MTADKCKYKNCWLVVVVVVACIGNRSLGERQN